MDTKIEELAVKLMFDAGIRQCENSKEISKFCQAVSVVAIKIIAGIEGGEFKRAFLVEAIYDDDTIDVANDYKG